MPPSRRIACFHIVALLVILAAPTLQAQSNWNDAAGMLARKIFVPIGPQVYVTLTVRNLSSLGDNDIAEVRRALRAQLHSLGIRLVSAKRASAELRVTLSENLPGYLWVAEVRKGETRRVAIVPVARPRPETLPPGTETLVVQKAPVYEQTTPILDLALLDTSHGDAPRLLLLDTSKVSLYKKQGTGWQLEQSMAIARSRPWPRDPRGRLMVRQDDSFDAYLPGVKCSGTALPTFTQECHESDDSWPLSARDSEAVSASFMPDRNFFDGRLAPQGGQEAKFPPFFSAAVVSEKGSTLRIFAGLDGRIRLFDKNSEPAAMFEGWGTSIVALKTGCGDGWQVLANRAGDSTERDSVEAYEIAGHSAVVSSAPVEFPGPVTALWPAWDGSSAIAVSRNLKTGEYEAYRLSVSCSH